MDLGQPPESADGLVRDNEMTHPEEEEHVVVARLTRAEHPYAHWPTAAPLRVVERSAECVDGAPAVQAGLCVHGLEVQVFPKAGRGSQNEKHYLPLPTQRSQAPRWLAGISSAS